MANESTREFGKRRPVAVPATAPVKRSGHVVLLLMGSFAVGGAAYALMPGEKCAPQPGMASEANAQCAPARGSSSGGGWWSSRSGIYSGDTSQGRQPNSSEPASGKVTRGGFGGFAHAFAAHFSGGG